MFKRARLTIGMLSLCLFLIVQQAIGVGQTAQLNLEQLDRGIVGYQLGLQTDKKYKLLIQKQTENYYYDIAGTAENFYPLQMGNGEYKISLLENISATQYKVIQTDRVSLALENQKDAFLGSTQIVCWDENDSAIKKAAELTQGLKSDTEKINAIYSYVVKTIAYDRTKAQSLTPDYIPDINSVYQLRKGICYDYSALFAAMLRSAGIPAKLAMGESNMTGNKYHAWNEVYDTASDQWFIVDTTVDAALYRANSRYSMKKSAPDYLSDRIY